MELIDAIRQRKSIRGYRPDPVDRELIKKILETAVRAPSTMNTQPWEFIVLAGEPLRKTIKGCAEKNRSGERPHPELEVISWKNDSVFRVRQVELAKHIFRVMDIPREDKVKRAAWMERGFRYFDAPAAIIICVDRSLTDSGPLLDLGAITQNICLAAMHFGLGTCIHDQGVMYPEVVREHAGIPDSKRIIIAISIGYPDSDNVVNTISAEREPVENLTTWVGF
jgi:nitroreductase